MASDLLPYQPGGLITQIEGPASVVAVVREGIAYRAHDGHYVRHVGQCSICKLPSDVQGAVHVMLDHDASSYAIADAVFHDFSVTINPRSVQRHAKEHYLKGAAAMQLLQAVGAATGEFDPKMLMPHHAARAVMQAGFALLAQGRMEIKASDLLGASKLLHDMAAGEQSAADTDMYQRAFTILLSTIYTSLGPTKFQGIMWSLASNPAMVQILGTMGFRSVASTTAAIAETSLESQRTTFDEIMALA